MVTQKSRKEATVITVTTPTGKIGSQVVTRLLAATLTSLV